VKRVKHHEIARIIARDPQPPQGPQRHVVRNRVERLAARTALKISDVSTMSEERLVARIEELVVKGGGAKSVREQCGISAARWQVFEESRASLLSRRAIGRAVVRGGLTAVQSRVAWREGAKLVR